MCVGRDKLWRGQVTLEFDRANWCSRADDRRGLKDKVAGVIAINGFGRAATNPARRKTGVIDRKTSPRFAAPINEDDKIVSIIRCFASLS